MSTLCKACREIFSNCSLDRYTRTSDVDKRTGYLHHPSAEALRQAADDGCFICERFMRPYTFTTPTGEASEFNPHGGPTKFSFDGSNGDRLYIGYQRSTNPYEYGDPIGIHEVKEDTAESIAMAAEGSRRSSFTGSCETMGLAKQWLHQCLQTHVTCRSQDATKFLPTRLLELAHSGARLIHTCERDYSSAGKYTTLSHCWGKKPELMLNDQTRSVLQQGLPYEAFDKTFRDAMYTTRGLGLSYIWIDCYCIMQGDSTASIEDWRKESRTMHLVYSNSTINIGATRGVDGRAGCFASRKIATSRSALIRWRKVEGAIERTYALVHDQKDPGMMVGPLRSHEHLPRGPIYERGWIVQEILLSPRMLHFCDDGIRWQCYTAGTLSEHEPHAPFKSPEVDSLSSFYDPRPGQLRKQSARLPGRRVSLWHDMLRKYSGTFLSRPEKDMVIAFEGVTRRLCDLTGDRYCNGYLESTLMHDLCWVTTGRRSLDPGRSRWKMWTEPPWPSWHWAATHYEVFFPYHDLTQRPQDAYSLVSILPEQPALISPLSRHSTLICLGRLIRIATTDVCTALIAITTFHADAGAWQEPLQDGNEVFLLPCSQKVDCRSIPSKASTFLKDAEAGILEKHHITFNIDLIGLVLRHNANGSYSRRGVFALPGPSTGVTRLKWFMTIHETMRKARAQIVTIE